MTDERACFYGTSDKDFVLDKTNPYSLMAWKSMH